MTGLARGAGISYEEMMGKLMNLNSLKRIAEPSEIASCAMFLASDDYRNVVMRIGANLGY